MRLKVTIRDAEISIKALKVREKSGQEGGEAAEAGRE